MKWVVVTGNYKSQAARQGLALLMASAVVVLKHETSTLRQSHKFISIDLTFGVGDYVGEVTSPDKFGSDPRWAIKTPSGGNIYGDFLYFNSILQIFMLFDL